MFYSLLPKFRVRYESFSFYCIRKTDEEAATDMMYDFLQAF